MLSLTLKNLAPIVALALILALAPSAQAGPAIATWPDAVARDEVGAAFGEDQAAVDEASAEVAPKATPKPKVKGKARRGKAKGKRKFKPHPVAARLTPPLVSKADPWALGEGWRWLGGAGLLILAAGGVSAGWAFRQAVHRSALDGEQQARHRRNAEAEVQELKAENSRLSRRVADSGVQVRRLSADNHDLRTRAEVAEAEVSQLRFERSIEPVQALMAQIAHNRGNIGVRVEAGLGLEGNPEASEALSREARLEKEAERLRQVLAVLRKAAKASPAPILPRDLLNGQEQAIYAAALAWAERQGLRLHAQVSMGEFLIAADGGFKSWVFRAFNARRVDFLITDGDWRPLVVIEHQGTGHWQDNWRLNDDIKRLVLRLAGLPLVETRKGEKDHLLHGKLDRALVRAKAAPTPTPSTARAS